MSYKIVSTYTKTDESPVDAFRTIPVLKADENITQEQIDLLQNTYPFQYTVRTVQNQLIISYTYNSEEDYTATSNDVVIKDLLARRTAWAELNRVTFNLRVL